MGRRSSRHMHELGGGAPGRRGWSTMCWGVVHLSGRTVVVRRSGEAGQAIMCWGAGRQAGEPGQAVMCMSWEGGTPHVLGGGGGGWGTRQTRQAGRPPCTGRWCASQVRPAGHHVLGGGVPIRRGKSDHHVLGGCCASQARPTGHHVLGVEGGGEGGGWVRPPCIGGWYAGQVL